MRRMLLGLALLGAAISAGCKAGSGSGSAGATGVGEGTFTVTVQNGQSGNTSLAIRGGYVTSVPAGIDCGVAPHTACSAEFAADATVVLTAVAVGFDTSVPPKAYMFLGWAGDCSGMGDTCALTGKADKYVLAEFGTERTSHANFSDGEVHGPAYYARATNGLDCFQCHGASLQGMGIAVGCNSCHRTPDYPPAAQPTIAFNPAAPMTGTVGQALVLSALATDPNGSAVTCSWSVTSKPADSTVSLAASGRCSGTPGTASFTPDLAGTYVVQVAPSNQTATLSATIFVAAQEYGGGVIAGTETTAGADLVAIATRLDAVLTVGKNTINPDQLARRLGMNPEGAAQTPISVVDVRDPEDFAKGHIPGAINVPLAQLPSVLLANPGFLPATELAIASYNGGDGNMATLLINAVRYNGSGIPNFALGLFSGMSAWSYDLELSPTRFDDDKNVRRVEDGAIVPGVAPAATYEYPAIGAFTAATDDVTKKILVRAGAHLASLEAEAAAAGVPHREAFWTTFVEYRTRAAAGQRPQVLSVRSPADFAKNDVDTGIPTDKTVNVNWNAVAKPANMVKIDPSRVVFVHCYTGHTGGQAAMALGIMGYKTRNVLYGLNGWHQPWSDLASAGGLPMGDFDKGDRTFDFPQHDWGTGIATLAGYEPPRVGCKACHSSLTAQWYDLKKNPPPGTAPTVESEGEG